MIDKKLITIYIDDIMIAATDLATHNAILAEVLRRLAKCGLRLNMEKCKFGYQRLDYLGYAVSADGIGMNDSHIKAIKEFPLPKNAKEVQNCIGLFSYFRRFVHSFSKVARPLQNLLAKGAIFNMDEDCVAAFTELKNRLISAPILTVYKPGRITELHCDASSIGFGAALMQKLDSGRFHPVAYFSKTTSPAESRYHSFELETLAIIYALRRFRIYLEGIPFTIITDCNSLMMTLNKKDMNPRISRWAMELMNYEYSIKHRPGVSMGHVDALCRCKPEIQLDFDKSALVALVDSDDTDTQLKIAQNRDSNAMGLKSKLEAMEVPDYDLIDGLLFKKSAEGKLQFYVPVDMEDNIIRITHEKIGHQSVGKTLDQIKLSYWFPNMREKTEKFIKNCLKCLLHAAPIRSGERHLYSIPKKPIPFDTIHADHLGPLPSLQSKKKHILVVIDGFT
jgi:hypothetical protein